MRRWDDMDWIFKDLAASVPQIRHVVLLSADGLRMAEHAADPNNSDPHTAEYLAATCASLQSLAAAVGEMFPHGDRQMRMVVIEVSGGFLYLMAAGARAYLAVMVDQGVDAGLLAQCMRDLVARIGEHLTSPPRVTGRPHA
jgi:predicted regulator of Ras-like GTPase activity (Roadblock/LC7/MglB family)